MSSVGWKVVKQTKEYGPYVTALLDGDDLVVTLKQNPLGLSLPAGPVKVPGSRDAADKICYVLSNLLEEVEAMQARTPTGKTPLPSLSAGDFGGLPFAGDHAAASSVLPPIELIRAASSKDD